MTFTVIHDDCLAALAKMETNSFHSVVTDPPAGISFMGRKWDGDRGGRDQWIAWMQGVATECLRVTKPGGHALVWALPRTSHWTVTAWENAGWEVRDRVAHLFGSGFPKNHDVSKAIDRAAGAEREVIGSKLGLPGYSLADNGRTNEVYGDLHLPASECVITAPTTDAAKQWEGWGSALKPACEDWWLLRKPLDGTIAANVLKHGCGGINVDACRVAAQQRPARGNHDGRPSDTATSYDMGSGFAIGTTDIGRFPANVVHDGSDEVEAAFAAYGETRARGNVTPTKRQQSEGMTASHGVRWGVGNIDGPIDAGDTGSASRFFYSAKASSEDRVVQCLGCGTRFINEPSCSCKGAKTRSHPTVKPVALMRWLTRLITPPGGHLLDPFAGSGTTGQAALLEGFEPTLIEMDADHIGDIHHRFAHMRGADAPLFRELAPKAVDLLSVLDADP